jgi:hypothetical protein
MRIPRVAYSVTSQGLVSACNLLLSLALLYYSEARHYVAFLLFLNVVQLLNGLQNALFVSPVGVLVPRLPAAEVARTERAAYRMTALVALAGLPFIAYFFAQPPRLDPSSVGIVAAIFVATVMLLQREIARNACLLRSDLPVLVKFDFLYFALAMLLAGAAVALHELSFVVAVLAFALPAGLSRLSRPQWPGARDVAPANALTAFGPAFWADVGQVARWSVPGVVVTWLFSNGYWFILERTQDTQTVATLGAARLLFAPVGLFIQGWLMQLRPLSVSMAHRGQMAQLRRIVIRQSAAGAACVMLVAATGYVLVTYYPQVLPRSLHAPGVTDYIFVWAVYFAIFWFRSGVSTLLMTRTTGFKTVFFANLVVCAVFYALFFGSLGRVPLPLSLASLIGAELLMIYLLNKQVYD